MTEPTACPTDGEMPHRRYPCDECPIRADNADNPASQFPPERWAALTATVVDPATGFGPDFDATLFGCHKGEPGSGADLACAGWLARFGDAHPQVRLALATGRLPESALRAGANWPPLHKTWAEVVSNHSNVACAVDVPGMPPTW
jgi:hypothetical protein